MYVWSGRDGYRKAWNNQVENVSEEIYTMSAFPRISESKSIPLHYGVLGELPTNLLPQHKQDSNIFIHQVLSIFLFISW